MRVVIVVDCYFPTTRSAAKLVHDLGVALRARGCEVSILAPSEHISARCQITEEDGLRIVRVRNGRLKGAGRTLRALREARLPRVLWRGAGEFLGTQSCDLVIFYSPSIFLGPLVRRLKQLWDCPAYLVLRDIWPQFLLDMGVLHEGLRYRYLRYKERQQNAAADVIGVQTEGDLDYIARQLLPPACRFEVLRNWAALDEGELPVTDYRRRLGLQEKVVFFYGGNFGVAQDVDNLLRLAAGLAAEPAAHVVLVGQGTERERLQAGIERAELRNVSLLPAVDHREYLAMLTEFDVGLISLDRRFRIQNMPGKLMAYMQCGVPALASVNPGNDLMALLEPSGAGFCCWNGEDERFVAYALRLAREPELRRSMGRCARRLLEESFSADRAAEQILGHWLPQTHDLAASRSAEPVLPSR